MPNYLVFNNVAQTGSNTYTPAAGTITDVTGIEKISTRQIKDGYIYTVDAGGATSTLTIESIETGINSNAIGIVSILDYVWPLSNINSVTCYRGATTFTTTKLIDVTDITGWKDSQVIQSSHYIVDAGNIIGIDKIEISITNTAAIDQELRIGHIFAGEYIEVKVKPNMQISLQDQQSADISNGGQFYYSNNQNLLTISAEVKNISSDDINTFIQSVKNHGKSQPILFISSEIDHHNMYCTFRNMPTFKTIESKDGPQKKNWRHEAKINLIENR